MADVVFETQGLTKRYRALVAVDGLSLQVCEGEVLGFLGPNGAGKTTSIHMMCGLLKPDAGRVLLHGHPVRGEDAEVRARVGVCPQNIILWERLTCLEQLQFMGEMYGLSARTARQRGARLLEEMNLASRRDQQARTLSGGMQRRLNLIMALVHDPEIVVLDEPEAGLDPQSRVVVRDYIRSLARNKTVILTTHNMDEADRVADRVAIIDQGRLLVLDTPAALKRLVGEGDVIEIGWDSASLDEAAVRQALAALDIPRGRLDARLAGGTLVVRALDGVGILPGILDALRAASGRPGEVRLRANTLEDVFIRLTGRGLRE